MSTTRRAPDNSPLSQERYMSSVEYAELRGLSGNAVARKAAYLAHPRKKSLLFWLQAMSLRDGGLPKLAREFIAASMDRIGTPTLLRQKLRDGKSAYPPNVARQIDEELSCEIMDLESEPWLTDEERQKKERAILSRSRADWLDHCRPSEWAMANFLLEIAINPKSEIRLPGEDRANTEERERFKQRHEELSDSDFRCAGFHGFPDVVGALLDFQDARAQHVRCEFVMTEIARQVWATLDTALKRPGRIALIEGAAGVGKTEAVNKWIEQHLGEARLISLAGVSHKTGFFRAIAKVLGLASSYTRTATEMQARVEDVLQSSRLLLVIDESQFGFSSGDRIYTQPELMNWVYSALANFNVPVALVATEQFGRKLRQAEQQVIWAGGPAFKRRLRPHVKLPAKPSASEMIAIARQKMPGASEAAIKEIVGYAGSTDYSLTNLVDAIQDAREIADEAGRTHITYEDARRAVSEFREPSDAASKQAFGLPIDGRGSRRRKAIEAPLQDTFTGHVRGAKIPPNEQDLPEPQSVENARFGTANSGRMGRTVLTT
jgi:hypothetical protein